MTRERRASSTAEIDLDSVALLLLAVPAARFQGLSPPVRKKLAALQRLDLLPPLLREHVEHLRIQAAALDALDEFSLCPPSSTTTTCHEGVR